jgi:hypothetical protein
MLAVGSLAGRNLAVLYHMTAQYEISQVFPEPQDWKAMYVDVKVDEMST